MPISTEALIEKFQLALDNSWGYIWGTAGIAWTQAMQNQKVKYISDKYGPNWKNDENAKNDNYYYAALYGAKWIGHIVADCSGLFAWAFKQLGGSIAHGSNSIWNNYCSSRGKLSGGKRTDGSELKPGSAVFTYNAKKKNRGHIGLYIGNGWVIEAKGTQAGVIQSKVTDSKWVEWGELKGINYPNQVPADAKDDDQGFPSDTGWRPTLRRGSKGDSVRECQRMLVAAGYDVGASGIDGDYGRATQSAVIRFQEAHGLNPDGVCGPLTWDMLIKAAQNSAPFGSEKTYNVIIKGLELTQAKALSAKYPGSEIVEGGEGK